MQISLINDHSPTGV